MFKHCKHTDGVTEVVPSGVTKQQAALECKERIKLGAGHAFRLKKATEKMGPASTLLVEMQMQIVKKKCKVKPT